MNLNDIAKFHEESKKTQFECKFCLKTYVRKTTLKAHSRKSIPCKGEVSKKLTKSADNGSADNLSINLEAISCEICKEEFPNEFRYRLHLNNAPRCSNELAQENRSLSSDSEEETSKSQTNSEMEFENDSNASEDHVQDGTQNHPIPNHLEKATEKRVEDSVQNCVSAKNRVQDGVLNCVEDCVIERVIEHAINCVQERIIDHVDNNPVPNHLENSVEKGVEDGGQNCVSAENCGIDGVQNHPVQNHQFQITLVMIIFSKRNFTLYQSELFPLCKLLHKKLKICVKTQTKSLTMQKV